MLLKKSQKNTASVVFEGLDVVEFQEFVEEL